MEYDPASPTDELEDKSTLLDLSDIPLPGNSYSAGLLDIPLPTLGPVQLLKSTENVKQKEIYVNEIANSTSKDDNVAPLKFTLKSSLKQNSGDVSNETFDYFESSKDSQNDTLRAMPKLQAMMKRSKPCQLPVGVLPSRIKPPPSEVKTELFLPKESDVSANNDQNKVNQYSNSTSSSKLHVDGPDDSLSNALREIEALNNFAQIASSNSLQSAANLSSIATNINLNSYGISNTNSSSTLTSIPNLMSIPVNPVHTNALLTTSTVKLPNTIMKFVNPQKFRSAQMIATPLIANPALATQSKYGEESRRRSRSRSHKRKHSRSRKRSSSRHRVKSRHRRHRSSSSSNSSRHYSSRRTSRYKKSKDRQTPDKYEQSKSRRNYEYSDKQKSKVDDGDSSSHRKITDSGSKKRHHSKDHSASNDKKINKQDSKSSNDECDIRGSTKHEKSRKKSPGSHAGLSKDISSSTKGYCSADIEKRENTEFKSKKNIQIKNESGNVNEKTQKKTNSDLSDEKSDSCSSSESVDHDNLKNVEVRAKRDSSNGSVDSRSCSTELMSNTAKTSNLTNNRKSLDSGSIHNSNGVGLGRA